jgi:hypothetical protein
MTPDVQPSIIHRYGYTWVQHPDGLYYGPRFPAMMTPWSFLEAEVTLGHSSVAGGAGPG